MASAATLRRRLVRQLEGKGLLREAHVRAAFLDVPRELFVPEYAAEHGLEEVYRDEAIVTKKTETGLGLSSSSQPGIMAEMLDQLRLERGQRVLEVGAGTGYNAALLAHGVGAGGRVVSVELDPDTARNARRALRGTGVKVVNGDGRDGYPIGAPYDRIIVTASVREIPGAWLEQLKPGGLLEVPLRLRTSSGLHVIPTLRRANGEFRSVSVICGGFMPLRRSPEDREPYWPTLVITRSAGAASTPLFALAGDCLNGLAPGAAKAVVAAICSSPKTRSLRMRASAKSLALYLALRGPAKRIVSAFDGRSFNGGLLGRNARGVALLPGWPTTTRLLQYGEPEAADELAALAGAWADAGRPDESSLEVFVRFRDGTSTIRTRWRGT